MSTFQLLAPVLILPLLLLVGYFTAKHPPSVHYPATPLQFRVKKAPANTKSKANNTKSKANGTANGSAKQETESLTIKSFLESRVPSLFDGYAPTWWLPTGHLQTLYVVSGNFSEVDKIVYQRTYLRLPDGGTLGLDQTPPPKSVSYPANTPVVIVQHGLTGGSYEAYVRSILAGACAPKEKGGLGYRAIVVNFRGCANVPLTSPQFYSGGHTEDLRTALLYISSLYPDAPLLGLGFSLGAGVLTRYLGEEGEKSRLRSGLALASPWDLVANSHRLETEFIPKYVYSKALGGNLVSLFMNHVEALKKMPENPVTAQIPIVLNMKNPTLKQMDQEMTRFLGGSSPPFPFESADAYYRWAGSHKAIHNIRVPYLAISSSDDPVVGHIPTDETEHSSTAALAVTSYGGHLGWFTGGNPFWGPPPDRWVRIPALEWLRAVGEDVVPGPGFGPEKVGKDREERDGFVYEKGRPHIGYRVLDESELVLGASGDAPGKGLIRGL